MAGQFINVVLEGRTTIITLNRPEAFNALSAEAHRELEASFDEFESDPRQLVAIITGAGTKAFCSGHDLRQQSDGDGLVFPASGFGGLTNRHHMTKPVIAAVNGVALGGGFEIALACDLIIAAENALFALPEPRVGLAAFAGGLHRLPRQIGLKHAMGMILTGRRVSASEGRELGFVNEVAGEGLALDVARSWAEKIALCSPVAVQASKEAVQRGLSLDLESAMATQWEFPTLKALLASPDAVEGPRAFVEKRSPVWDQSYKSRVTRAPSSHASTAAQR